MVAETEVVRQAYAAFNARDVEGALRWMTEDVSWPRASEGGRVVGKDAIRAYWARQWSEFDPRVEPVAMEAEGVGRVRVRVQQVVRTLGGELLFQGEVVHVLTFVDGLIAAMTVEGEEEQGGGPARAFRGPGAG